MLLHNRLEAVSDDGFLYYSAIVPESSRDYTTDFLFEHNFANGGYSTIFCPAGDGHENVVFRNNRFGREYRDTVGQGCGTPGIEWDMSTNLFVDTLEPAPI